MRSRVLFINLSSYEHWSEDFEVEEWLGGVGAGIRLLREHAGRADPLSEGNAVVLSTGQFTPAYPMASKCVGMFRSPLTGTLGESHAGGRVATSIANAGYLAVVILGRAEEPVYVVVENDRVHFRDARAIWRVRDSIVVGRIIAKREGGAGVRSVLRIGAAGCSMVRYACVNTETYRHFGRLGMGAVFGSKNLKALVISGRGSFTPERLSCYRRIYREIFTRITSWKEAKKYYTLGTAANVQPLNEMRSLPSLNLRQTHLEGAENISGEAFAERVLGRRVACSHCPVACIHIGALRVPYGDEPYFYKTLMVGYDYELIYSLGSMLGIRSAGEVLRLINQVERLGMDAISAGVALAWATEALERKLVSRRETIEELKFGRVEGYIKATEHLASGANDFYRALGMGVEHASRIYGGEEFALSFGGNEMPGYCTGYGAYIGYLIGSRHSHLDAGGYELDQKLAKEGRELPPEELVDTLVRREVEKQLLSTLVVCFFARSIYTPELVATAFEPLGMEVSPGELMQIAERIYAEKQRYRGELGFSMDRLRVPERALKQEALGRSLSREYVERALRYFAERYL